MALLLLCTHIKKANNRRANILEYPWNYVAASSGFLWLPTCMYKYFDIMATTTMQATNNPLTKVGHIYLMWDEIQVKQCLWSLFPILSVQILYYLPTFANRYIHTYNISMTVIDDWTSHNSQGTHSPPMVPHHHGWTMEIINTLIIK